jgi:hypothetical protein
MEALTRMKGLPFCWNGSPRWIERPLVGRIVENAVSQKHRHCQQHSSVAVAGLVSSDAALLFSIVVRTRSLDFWIKLR